MLVRRWWLPVMALAASAVVSFCAATAIKASGPQPFANGSQRIQSGPGVYDQTSAEYSTSWSWSQASAGYDYYWYVFTSGGTLVGSGHKQTGGGGNWSGAANVYYLKEYNNEPAGSGHINVLDVLYCC